MEFYLKLFVKFLISFSIPLCWAAILCPLAKKMNKAFYGALIVLTLMSVGLLICREIIDNRRLINDITTIVLGLFFGFTAFSLVYNSEWIKRIAKRLKISSNYELEITSSTPRERLHTETLTEDGTYDQA